MPFTANAIVILGFALSALLAEAATAQTPATGLSLPSGARVRVSSSTPGPFYSFKVGTVLAQRGDTLSLRPEGTQDSLALSLGSITQLEVSAGTHSHVGRGMALGLVGGASLGAIVGAASYAPCKCYMDFGRGFDAAALGVAGGLLGTLVGGFVGARRTENWEQVTATARRVALRLAPFGKGGLAVSATF